MKIVFLTPTLEVHGGNIVMLKHADYLLKQGHEIVIIAPNKPIELPIVERIRVVTYPQFPSKWVDFFTFQLVYLVKVVRNIEKADFIIPIYAPLIVHALVAKKMGKIKVKVVVFFQDSLRTLWVGPYIRFLLRRPVIQEQIASCVAISAQLAEQYNALSGKVATVIPNGIEDEHFYPRGQEKQNVILFVGRLSKPKGFKVFKKAFELIQKEFPDIHVKVVGPKLLPHREDSFEYIHYENREQLAKLYSEAQLYINASFAESFALPPLEAMSAGTAVVITDTGSREYAKDGVNCSVVPVGDYVAMANAAIALLKNNRVRRSFEVNGVITAKKYIWKYSLKRFEEYLLLLKD